MTKCFSNSVILLSRGLCNIKRVKHVHVHDFQSADVTTMEWRTARARPGTTDVRMNARAMMLHRENTAATTSMYDIECTYT